MSKLQVPRIISFILKCTTVLSSIIISSIIILFFLCSFNLFAQKADKIPYLKKNIQQYETLLSKNPNDTQTLKTLGILYHNLSVLGEKKASSKALEYLEKANKLTEESDVEIIAYLGSSYTLKGRDAPIPFMKISYVKKGCKLIDKAIKKEPKNITARMVRIYNSLALPSFFNRLKYTEKDCLFLINSYEKKELELNKDTLAEIFFNLGEFYYKNDKLDKAKEYYKKTAEVSPECPAAISAKEKLLMFK